jgi:1-acyl-sn-glycerol-3-phosphate acyltransferase
LPLIVQTDSQTGQAVAGSWFYSVLRAIICWWARWYLRLEVVGREHIPAAGGLLVAGNHVSYLDVPMLACALGRQADFMGKRELFHHPVFGLIYRSLGGFPIRRGGVTKEALSEAIRRLRSGRVVVMYPEGQISLTGGLLPPKPGLGLIVARAGVPVLPAYVTGTDEAMPRGKWWIRPRRVTVRLGPPLRFSRAAIANDDKNDKNIDDMNNAGGDQDKAQYREISRTVMDAIERLHQESQVAGTTR